MARHARLRVILAKRWVLALVLASVVGVAVASSFLFTQTFPSVVVEPRILSSGCETLVMTPSFLFQGESGTVVAQCSGGGAAFTVAYVGFAAPTFALPTGYTQIGIVSHTSPLQPCSASDSSYNPLASGTFESFPTAAAAFDYCVTYTSAPAGDLGSFTVAWNQ